MTNEDYTKITWPEVRKGDVLMHKDGDRLTVERAQWEIEFPVLIHTATSRLYADVWIAFGFTPYRKVEPLPDVDGIYLSAEHAASRWSDTYSLYSFKSAVGWATDGSGRWIDVPENEVPRDLVRLVPMPTEEQIRETLFKTDPGTIYGVDAVVDGMKSLLGGGDNA